ncbi:PrsW family glutamic-type intramembrane protease [Actinopolymorpha pittospori]
MNDVATGVGTGRPGPEHGRSLTSYAWGRVFLLGLAVWLVAVILTLSSGGTALVPTVVLLGSFLIPLTYATWVYERGRVSEITLALVVRAFLVSGLLGLLSASLLDNYLNAPTPFLYAGFALAQELVKVLALLYVARRVRRRTLRTGLVLGATVGFGFGAFETAGQALQALMNVSGLSMGALVETELLRALLAPVGQGLWTALIGGTIFAATRGDRWRFTSGVFFAYLGGSLLHALWDSLRSVAVVFTLLTTNTSWEPRLLTLGYIPRPSTAQVHLYTVTTAVGYVLVAALGVLWLGILRRRMEPVTAILGPPEAAVGATEATATPAGPAEAVEPAEAAEPTEPAEPAEAVEPAEQAEPTEPAEPVVQAAGTNEPGQSATQAPAEPASGDRTPDKTDA